MGHDWGGVVAWHTAAIYPELVRKLVILNAPHPARFRELLRGSSAQRRKSWYVGFFQLSWLPELSIPRSPAWVKRFFHASGADATYFDDHAARQYAAALGQPGARTAMLNYYRSLGRRMLNRGVQKAPHRLAMPTLVLWGKHDVALDIANADQGRLQRWVPDVQVELLEASHWVQHDAPERVSEELVRFFS